ncbi:MAG: hypothetical protein ABI921_05155, partial [Panacibacter sp.]
MKIKLHFCTIVLLMFSLSASANIPEVDWFRTDSGSGTSIVMDTGNNVYTTTSIGSIYLTKHDKFGNLLWQKNFTTNVIFNYEYPWKVMVDSKNNIIVIGDRHTHGIENGDRLNTLIILKYNPQGILLWQQLISGYFSAFYQERYHNSVKAQLDANDNIYVASGGNVEGQGSGFNAIKINSTGNIIWQKVKSFGSSTYHLVENIRNKGKLLALGGFGLYTNNALLWVLDTSGTTLGLKANPGYSGRDIGFDNNNNIYLLTAIENGVGANTLGDISV